MARDGRRVAKVQVEGRHAQRWLDAVVDAEEGRPLHVATVYGYDLGQPGAAEQNAALFTEVFEAMAGLGQAPWVVGTDWNEEADAI